jgi:predicted Rossmann fold flavoprotein
MRIAIIGGGAAGLMAAATLAEQAPQAHIVLIEKNDGLGKKVLISGGGRCNVTTGIADIRTVLMKYPRGGKFLNSAMRGFPPDAVYAWFEAHSVPLKIEEDLRVFPISNDGHDIVGVFEQLFRNGRVDIRLKAQAKGIRRADGGFEIDLAGSEPLRTDAVVLTTGGQAYRHTGSTGDGYGFAIGLGHRLTPLAASLNAFFTTEPWTAEISGLSFEKARIWTDRGPKLEATGPFLFTHKGVSGPAVFALSSLVAFETYDKAQPLDLWIDLFPDRSTEDLGAELDRTIAEHGRKAAGNVLGFVVSKSLAAILCRELAIDPEAHAAELPKTDRRRIVGWLKAIPLHAVARGAGDEFVTAGGIDLSDVNPSTMESKLVPNLFFAGEILDIDGFTGGFNLQASWATGRLAGMTLAERA